MTDETDLKIAVVEPKGDFHLDPLSQQILLELGKPKEWGITELAKELKLKPGLIRSRIKTLNQKEYVDYAENKAVIKKNIIQDEDKLDDLDKDILSILSRANRLGAAELQNILNIDTVHRITSRCGKLLGLKLLDKHKANDKRVHAEYSLHKTFLCLGDLVCIPIHLSNQGGFDTIFHITGSCPFKDNCNYPDEPCKLYPLLSDWSKMTGTVAKKSGNK